MTMILAMALAAAAAEPPVALPPALPPGPEAPDEGPAELTVHDLRKAHVPLVLMPLDTAQASAPLWVKGDRPKDNVLARAKLRPLEAVVVEEEILPGQRAGKTVLLLTFAGETSEPATVADAKIATDRLWCAADAAQFRGRLLCLKDEDGDGTFEASGIGNTAALPMVEQIAIVSTARPLPKPVAYRPARADELPEFAVEFSNCGKGYDDPRYQLSAARAVPNSGGQDVFRAMQMLTYRSGQLDCRKGETMRPGDPHYPAGLAGGRAAKLGDLVISVGAKDAGAPVKLHGFSSTDRLYRFDGMGVRPLALGPTQRQSELEIAQAFDKPAYVTAGEAKVNEGQRLSGDVLLEIGFAHSYTGRLTADTKIATLFSKRSLPKGTLLYGIPMSQRRVTTINGIPIDPLGSQGRPESHGLVWCAPIEEDGKWTATCLPWSGGSYAMLKGQTPAFEVRSLRYATGSPNNPGAVPVLEGAGDFGKPLSYRFILKALKPASVTVTQQTLLGGDIVHTRDLFGARSATGGTALRIGNGTIHIEKGLTDDRVAVSLAAPIKQGTDVSTRFTPLVRPGPTNIRVAPPPPPPKVSLRTSTNERL